MSSTVSHKSSIFELHTRNPADRLVHADFESTKLFPTFRPLWFGLFLRDAASFQALLCIVMMYKNRVHGTRHERKAIGYQSKALRLVHERLSDSFQRVSVGIVITIVLFLLHDVRLCALSLKYTWAQVLHS